MLLGTLAASVLGNLLAGKRTIRTGEVPLRVGQGTIIAGQDFKWHAIL